MAKEEDQRSDSLRFYSSFLSRLKVAFHGYPIITEERYLSYVTDKIKSQPSLKADVREYWRFCKQNFPFLVFFGLILGSVLFSTKYNFYAFIVRFRFQNYDPTDGMESLDYIGANGTREKFKKFACLVTNCSNIALNQTFDLNLAKLPVWLSCYPNLNFFYAPIVNLDYFGLATTLVVSAGVLIAGFYGPITRYLNPKENETTMFVVAPKLTRIIVAREIDHIAAAAAESLTNFRDSYGLKEFLFRNRSLRPSLVQRSSLKILQSTRKIREKGEDELEYHMPLARSNWWLVKSSGRHCWFMVFLIGCILLITSLIIMYINYSIDRKHDDYFEYANYLKSVGCFIWAVENEDQVYQGTWQSTPGQVVHLDRMFVGWSYYSIVESAIFFFHPLFNLCSILQTFYTNSLDLAVWVADLRARLVLLVEMTVLCGNSWSAGQAGRKHSSSCTKHQPLVESRLDRVMELFCQRFKKAGSFNGYFVFNYKKLDSRGQATRSKLLSTLENERFARLMLEGQRHQSESSDLTGGSKGNHHSCQMEQIYLDFSSRTYINLRLLISRVDQYGQVMTIIILFTFLINISLVVTYIYMNNILKSSSSLTPIVMLSLAWVVANLLIITGSKFNANARKLHLLIWTTIARSRQIESVDVQHMRILWLKQVVVLDSIGGLSYRALGVRITYVNIIQLVIWISSLFVLAMKGDV